MFWDTLSEGVCGNQGEFIGSRVVCHDNLKCIRVRVPLDRLLPDRKQLQTVLFDGMVLDPGDRGKIRNGKDAVAGGGGSGL